MTRLIRFAKEFTTNSLYLGLKNVGDGGLAWYSYNFQNIYE